MKASLVVLTPGKQEGKSIALTVPEFHIGRDPQCHLRPASPLISKRHCALLVRDGRFFVRDHGSTNGTLVNDERVEGEKELLNGDRLEIGPLQFGVRLETTPSVDQPTPLPPTKLPKPAVDDDEALAAELLAMQDDAPTVAAVDPAPGPTALLDPNGAPAQETAAPAAAPEKPSSAKKTGSGNTATAAEDILKRYMRRSHR